jgi:hypothetical protein
MEIERVIKERKRIGFKCDLCQKNFRTDMFYEEESWPYSDTARLFIDRRNPKEDEASFKYADLCEKCFDEIARYVIHCGGKFHHF